MKRAMWMGGAAAGLALLSGSCSTPGSEAAEGSGHGGGQCFYARNVSSWAPADRDTVNLRVSVNDIYQLKLLGDCPNIDWVEGVGLQHRGSDWICSGLDAELLAPQPGGGPALRCAVRSIRKLSREEAAALPPKQHP